jgi:hypothetical protein
LETAKTGHIYVLVRYVLGSVCRVPYFFLVQHVPEKRKLVSSYKISTRGFQIFLSPFCILLFYGFSYMPISVPEGFKHFLFVCVWGWLVGQWNPVLLQLNKILNLWFLKSYPLSEHGSHYYELYGLVPSMLILVRIS